MLNSLTNSKSVSLLKKGHINVSSLRACALFLQGIEHKEIVFDNKWQWDSAFVTCRVVQLPRSEWSEAFESLSLFDWKASRLKHLFLGSNTWKFLFIRVYWLEFYVARTLQNTVASVSDPPKMHYFGGSNTHPTIFCKESEEHSLNIGSSPYLILFYNITIIVIFIFIFFIPVVSGPSYVHLN